MSDGKGFACAVQRVALAVACAVGLSAPSVAEVPERAFLQRHCIDCHDRDGREAGLSLEDAVFAPNDPDNAGLWEKVFDRVARGEMPPPEADRPAADETKSFLSALEEPLRAAGLARHAREGRGPMRRLTRTEYENTVNDLLAIRVGLRELFPDDAITAGFDKVGAGLTLSASHFEGYQAAADKALDAAMPAKHFAPMRFAKTGAELFEARKKELDGHAACVDGDALVLTSRLFYPYTGVFSPWAPRGGRYRVTVTAQARNNDGRPLPLGIGVHDHTGFKPDAPDLSDWRDILETEPTTVTFEIDLEAEQQVFLFGPTLAHRDVVIPKHRAGEPWTKSALAITRLEVDGPLEADGTIASWPPQSYRILFGDLPLRRGSEVTGEKPPAGSPDPWVPASDDPRDDSRRLIAGFLPRAFRRPVSEEVVAEYVSRAHADLDAGVPFHKAMRDAWKAILCSPRFFMLEEVPGRLDGHAIASRLSYFLWNGPPDEPLSAAAASGSLDRPEGRYSHVERMLADRRAVRFEHDFLDQWLELAKIDATSPDGTLYPEFDAALRLSALQETRRVFHEMLVQDRGVEEIVAADWTFLNEPLAALYGLPTVSGHELRKASLPADSRRGGFLTQASILKVTADGTKTSPILRGKWVTQRILGITPPAPPDAVPAVEPDIRGATTIREQLAKHRSSDACAGCHRLIDPPGFALESFDAIGGWRDYYRVSHATGDTIQVPRVNKHVHRGPAVEQGYVMPDGRAFADINAFKQIILEDSRDIAMPLAANLVAYATGAPVQFADRHDVAAIVDQAGAGEAGLRRLVHAVIESRLFLHK